MGKRGHAAPKAPEDATWAKEQYQWLSTARRCMPPPGVAVSSELFGEYLERAHAKATSSAGAAASSSSSGCAAAAAADNVAAEAIRAAGLQARRHSALLATGFEPQRRTMFVEGRPTQAASR